MGQAHDHVDLTFGLTFQPCSRLSLALATRYLIKVSHTREEGREEMKKKNKTLTQNKKNPKRYSLKIIPRAYNARDICSVDCFVKQTLQKWDDGAG